MLTSDCGHFAVQSAWFESTKVSLARLCRLKTPRPWQPLCFVLVSYLQFPSQMRRPWRPASHTPRHCSHNTQISDLPAKFDEWLVAKAKTKKLSDVNIFQSLHSIIVYYVYTVLLLLLYIYNIYCRYCMYLPPLQPGSCFPTASDQSAAKQNTSNEGPRAEPVSDCSWHLCASSAPAGRSSQPVLWMLGAIENCCWHSSCMLVELVRSCLKTKV